MEYSGKSKLSLQKMDVTQDIASNPGGDASAAAAVRVVSCMMSLRSTAIHRGI
jgi:hypothetical protein